VESEHASFARSSERLTYDRPPLLGEAWQELKDIRRFRELVRHLVASDLRKEHTGTVFGAVWWVLDPLLLMGIYSLLVVVIFQRGGPDYGLFVLSPLIVWKFFRQSVGHSISTTLSKARSIRQVAFPKAVLPLSATLVELFHLGIGLALFYAIAVPFDVYPSIYTPLVLVVVAVEFTLALGFAFLLSAVNFVFRDIQNLSTYVFRLMWWLSPGLYAIDRIPERWRHLYSLNPFATLFPAFRDVLLYERMPPWGDLGLVFAFGVGVLVLGFLVFVKMEPYFVKVQ
jgi:ABC-type polysaccharide/polyol phosphate export permease